MRFTGACHCNAITYSLDWPDSVPVVPARRCTCSYCTRFNGIWTSNPEAFLELQYSGAQAAKAYRFATASADFCFCRQCGVVVAAICRFDNDLRAVLNINTLANRDDIAFENSDSNFDGEQITQRMGRRNANWMPVTIKE